MYYNNLYAIVILEPNFKFFIGVFFNCNCIYLSMLDGIVAQYNAFCVPYEIFSRFFFVKRSCICTFGFENFVSI